MFAWINRWLLDYAELRRYRAERSYWEDMLREKTDLESEVIRLAHELRDSQIKVVAFRGSLQNLSIVAADIAKCKCLCKLCRGVLYHPLDMAKTVLTSEPLLKQSRE